MKFKFYNQLLAFLNFDIELFILLFTFCNTRRICCQIDNTPLHKYFFSHIMFMSVFKNSFKGIFKLALCVHYIFKKIYMYSDYVIIQFQLLKNLMFLFCNALSLIRSNWDSTLSGQTKNFGLWRFFCQIVSKLEIMHCINKKHHNIQKRVNRKNDKIEELQNHLSELFF